MHRRIVCRAAKPIDALALDILVVDCIVIKIENAGEKYVVMPTNVEAFEKSFGKIRPNTFVIFSTGWDAHWNTPKKYHNDHIFPCVHASTAELLVERNIAGLGIDTLSADTGAGGFPVHRTILGAGKYLVENIANAGSLPPVGAKILVLPMKIKDAAEAPIRLVALIPKT